MKANLSFNQRLLVLATAAAVVTLAACGGGGGSSGTAAPAAAPAAPAAVSGTITGFGSVIIDGVHYDDSATTVAIDTDPAAPSAGTLSDLKLGMRVEAKIHDGKLDDVVIHASLVGPIATIDAANTRFTIYGQTVQVATTGASPTVFEGAANFAGLAIGDRVEVHGTVDANKAVAATRIERRPQTELAKGVRIGGVIAQLDSAAKTFRLNDMAVDYAGATVLPEGTTLANGQSFVAYSDTPPGAQGFKAKVLKIETGDEAPKPPAADIKTSLSGQVTDWVSASSFKVRGAAVDASAATFDGGSAADLGAGAWLVVIGKVQGDVVKADRIEFKTPPAAQPVKLKGEIREFDAAAHTFHFLGVTLKLADTVELVNGGTPNLVNGKRVEITGTPGVDGVVLVTRLEFLPDLAPQVSVVGGRLFDLTDTGFKLPGIAVSFDSHTSFDGGVAADLANGVMVLAKGTFNPTTKAIAATWIEIVKAEGQGPRVTGPIGDYASQGNFRVGGQKVDASNAVFSDGVAADLANGAVVEVTGSFAETAGVRVLVATKLRFLTR